MILVIGTVVAQEDRVDESILLSREHRNLHIRIHDWPPPQGVEAATRP